MSYHSLFSLSFLSLIAAVTAQSSSSSALIPLASRHVDPNNIPFQVVGSNGGPRGPQFGYNLCNSTTEGPNSDCQTMFINDFTDFCMWSSPLPNDTIGVSEAYEVAWCTKAGHGTRIIPANTITGAQWLYAKNYIQVVGFLSQQNLNIFSGDFGGELDPHGDDEQGNPLGGIAYTNGFGDSSASFHSRFTAKQNSTAALTQVTEWIDFIGSGIFCLKFCKNDGPDPAALCNHIYDEIGCTYNAVADYNNINGSFVVCDSDDMTPPGVFTTAPGQTTTWVQPFTGNPQPPYTPNPISSSNCQTYQSTDLWPAEPTIRLVTSGSVISAVPVTGSGSVPAATSGASGSNGASSKGSGPAATGGSSPSTGTTGNSTGNTGSGALALAAPFTILVATIFGAFFTIAA